MKTINLHHLCPFVFQHFKDLSSDIWNQDVVFQKGNTYLIEAASGTGKSSLCNFICGYRNDYNGQLCFDGQDSSLFGIKDWTMIRRKEISHMIQDLRLFPELTAFENIAIKNELEHFKSAEEIMQWMEFLGIADKRDIPVRKMSFGQQQRVALLRALVQPFDFLLADEPISHLDNRNAQLLIQLMLNEVKKREAGVIITSIGKHLDIHYDKIYHL